MNKKKLLSIAIFIAGLCSIIYELLISTTATYFLGDGVRQFSLIIGVYLFSMGVGAYIAQLFADRPLRNFIIVEYLLGVVGGLSVPILYFLFTSMSITSFQLVCLGIIFIIGFLTGMEIPLLTFSFNSKNHKENLSNVLSLDYVGGLVATLLFPFAILPFVGLFYASLVFGAVNIILGIILSLAFYGRRSKFIIWGIIALIIPSIIGMYGGKLLNIWEHKIYKNPIALNIQTPYQKIVMTKRNDNVKLFLNRVIQFASQDEHRYHETLVHIPMAFKSNVKNVLVLGGGENLATRELVKYPSLKKITVVDIDTMMFHLALTDPEISKINDLAPFDPRVDLIADDAFSFLYNNTELYDIIISDLPDPNSQSLARLYSLQFFKLVKRNLADGGIFITQSGDINNSNQVFSCIHKTLADAFETDIRTAHVYIPSFGDWGFNIAGVDKDVSLSSHQLPMGLKYLDSLTAINSLILPKDVTIADVKINTLDSPNLLTYFLEDYAQFKSNGN